MVEKDSGLLTMGSEKVKDKTVYYYLNDYVKKGNHKSRHRVFIVHRLDRDTSGLLVFTKNEKSKRFLQDEWQTFQKKYFAIVHGILSNKESTISTYLRENQEHRVYSVDDPSRGKLAETRYQVLDETKNKSLLGIELITGRKNQIRVHFSELGSPVVGDSKYGKEEDGKKKLSLHAASLSLIHPFSKAEMSFSSKPPGYFETHIKGAVKTCRSSDF